MVLRGCPACGKDSSECRCGLIGEVPIVFLPPWISTGVYAWAVWTAAVGRPVRALVAWLNRPVTNCQPLIGGRRAARDAEHYGRHDRSVGEQTIPLADLLARLADYKPHDKTHVLYGAGPLEEWTHPERYGPPKPPPELVATAAPSSPVYAKEA